MIKRHVSSTPLLNARQGVVFFSGMIVVMFFSMIVPRALSFLPGLYGVIGLTAFYVSHRTWPRIDHKLLVFFSAFIILMALSCLWSPDPSFSFERALKTAPLLLSGFALLSLAGAQPDLPCKNRLAVALALLCSISAVILFIEYTFGFPLSRILLQTDDGNLPKSIRSGFLLNRSSVFLALLCLPAGLCVVCSDLGIKIKWLLLFVMAVCLLAAMSATQSQTAQIVAALSVLMLVYPAHVKWARRLLVGAVVIVTLAAPALIVPAYKSFFASGLAEQKTGLINAGSVPHRLEVWNFMATEIFKKPLFGHGVEAARFLKSEKIMPHMRTDHVLHPHNAVLQVWVEFGVLGVFLAIAFMIFLMRKLDDMPPILQRYYTVLFVVTMAMLSMGYGLWQGWQLGMIMAIPAFSAMATNLYCVRTRS